MNFDIENLGIDNLIPYTLLKKPIEKLVYSNKIKQVNKNYDKKRDKFKVSNVQNIINSITKNDVNSNKFNLENYLEKGKFTENEYNFYSAIMDMRVFNKKITIPKTICTKPIEIYYYCDGTYVKDKSFNLCRGSYFTNDLLYWSFKWNNYMNVYVWNNNKNNIELIDKCVKLKKVSIISNNFRLLNKEIISGYIQDYNSGVSFPCYNIVPRDVAELMMNNNNINNNNNNIQILSTTMSIDGVEYNVEHFDEYILINRSNIDANAVSKIVKNQKLIHKEDDKFLKGLKISDNKENIYYLEILKHDLKSFCPSILQFPPFVEIDYSFLIVCEVDLDRYFDLLYKSYFIEMSKDDKIDMVSNKDIKSNFVRLTTYQDMQKLKEERKKNLEKLNTIQENNINEKIKTNIDEIELDNFVVNENDIIALETDFIFWDNIPSCFEFIGIIGYTCDMKFTKKTEIFRYIYLQYNRFKDYIYLWKRCYDIFKHVVLGFYDSCSARLGYDRLMKIREKVKKFLTMYNTLKESEIYKSFKLFISNISFYCMMINEFVCKDSAEELGNLINLILDRINSQDPERLEAYIRGVGLYCLSILMNGNNYMIPEIRSPSAFLGDIEGSYGKNMIVDHIQDIIMRKVRKNRIKLSEDVNKVLDIETITKKRLENQINNSNISNKRDFLNKLLKNSNVMKKLYGLTTKKNKPTDKFDDKDLIGRINLQEKNEMLDKQKKEINIKKDIVENQMKLNDLESKDDKADKIDLEDENLVTDRAQKERNFKTYGIEATDFTMKELEKFKNNPSEYLKKLQNDLMNIMNNIQSNNVSDHFSDKSLKDYLNPYGYQYGPYILGEKYLQQVAEKDYSKSNIVNFLVNEYSNYFSDLLSGKTYYNYT